MSSSCILVKNKATNPIATHIVYMIIGVGSVSVEASGASVVASLEQKFRKPKDVEQKRVGNKEVCATYRI